MIIVRDVIDHEMTVYNPDGSTLVVTHNMLCINDILIQIREQKLEGYSIRVENFFHEIKPNGRIAGSFPNKYAEQLRMLMDDEITERTNRGSKTHHPGQ